MTAGLFANIWTLVGVGITVILLAALHYWTRVEAQERVPRRSTPAPPPADDAVEPPHDADPRA
jgi:hypothetical protein